MSLLIDDPILQQTFVADVEGHGQHLLYTRGLKCPCSVTSSDANRARIDCLNCFGIGFLYDASSAATSIEGIVSQVHINKQLIDSGIAMPGDMLLTLAPYCPVFMKDYDMIRLTIGSGEPYEGDVISRGTRGAIAGNANNDLLAYEAVTVERCFAINPQTQALIDYTLNTDFTISGRVITWITPLVLGTLYSIRYTCIYDWIAFVSPVERFERNVSLGQKALLRRRQLVLPASASTLT